MAIVHYEQPAPLPASQPGDEHKAGPQGWVARLRAAAEYAQYIAQTEFVPEALRDRPAAIAAAMLYGAEVGFTPMQSLRSIAVIKGKPTLTSEAQRSLVLAAGHELWFDESTTTRAIAAGRRQGEERIGRVTWTLDDAKRAGIAGGNAWRTYPAEMLRARASAALARAMFADVIGGMPAAEEIEDTPDNGPTIPPPTPPPPPPPADIEAEEKPKTTRTRKRAAAATPAREPVPPTPPADQQPTPSTDPLATEAMRRRIFATMRDVGITDRQQRLDYIAAIVGHDIETSNELTVGEATKLIDALEQLAERKKAGAPAEPDTKTDPQQTVPYNELPPGY